MWALKKLQNPGFFNIIPNLFPRHICQVQLISGIYLLIYGPNLNRIIGIELKWHGNGNLLCLNLNSNNQTIIRLFGSVLPIHRHHQALKWKKEIFKGDPLIFDSLKINTKYGFRPKKNLSNRCMLKSAHSIFLVLILFTQKFRQIALC